MNRKDEVVKEEIVKYKGDFIPIEQKRIENGVLRMTYKWTYDENNNLITYAFKGLTTSFGEKINYLNNKISEVLSFHNITDIDNFENTDYFSQKLITYTDTVVNTIQRHFKLENNNRSLENELNITYSFQNKILERRDKHSTIQRKYNEFNQETEFIEYDKDGNIIGKGFSLYNDKGDLLETSFETNRKGKRIFKYKYDEFGNWTESLEYENDLLISKMTRQIEYN